MIPILALIFAVLFNYLEGNINNSDFSEIVLLFTQLQIDNPHSFFVLMPYSLKRFKNLIK